MAEQPPGPARRPATARPAGAPRRSAQQRSHDRSRGERSAAHQAVASRLAPQTRLPGQPSLRRLVAREVIAWHNRHPLARQISRRDITGFGVVSLPFSPLVSAAPEADAKSATAVDAAAGAVAGAGAGSPAALASAHASASLEDAAAAAPGSTPGAAPTPSAVPVQRSGHQPTTRRFPMFDDLSLIPGLGRSKVVALALAHGWASRPGLPEWPLRQVPVSVGWQEADAQRLHLQVVALKRGRGSARRVLVGRAVAGQPLAHVLGQRLWSWPRVAAAGTLLGSLLLATGALVVWAWAQSRPGPEALQTAQRSPSWATPAGPMAAPAAAPEAAVASAPAPGPAQGRDPEAPTEGWPAPVANPPPRQGSDDIPWMPGATPPSGDPRSAAPVTYALTLPPSTDNSAVQASAAQLRAALKGLGRTASDYRVDITGTPQGDAVTLQPMPSPEEARRMMRLLAARGIAMSVVQY